MNCRCCGRGPLISDRPWRKGQRGGVRLVGRHLCAACHRRLGADGRVDYERRTRTREDVLADYRLLTNEGYKRRQIAERIGMTLNALNQVISRAKRAGAL